MNRPLAQSPELSVVVVVLTGGASLARCLEALRRQASAPPLEVIVPLDDRLQEGAAFRQRFPEVKFLELPGQRSHAERRAAGLRAARGRILALTEDQCIPPERWCASVVEAHAAPHAAIGGPVEKHRPDTPRAWAIYLRELGTYMPPVQEGPSQCLTDCNVSYKRDALESIAPVWAQAFHEPRIHAALRQRGETLWLSPALLTFQQRTMALGPALAERYAFGRLYASLRAIEATPGKRLVLLAASPLLPAWLVARVLLGVLRKRRHVGPCVAALPYLVLFAAAWSCGEFVGYCTRRPSSSP